MHKLFRSRVTAVVSGAVVVVGLGAAGATAAGMIGSDDIRNNSIQSRDIQDNTLQAQDIERNAVGTAEIAPNSVTTRILRDESVGMGSLTPFVQNQVDDRAEINGLRQRVDALQQELASDGETTVTDLGGHFSATNESVSLTGDGVAFGPYTAGGSEGGSIAFDGLNGEPVSAVTNLVYYARYVSQGDTGGVGVPYLRIFTEDVAGDPDTDEQHWIFSPNTQSPAPDIAEGPFHEWVATSGTWRYNDDAGNFPGQEAPFADLVAAHGDETISGIYISTGFTAGTDLSALLRWMEVNGEQYEFTAQ